MDLDLKRKILRMLISGFYGKIINIMSDLNPYLKLDIGGIILYDHHAYNNKYKLNVSNPEQIAALTHELQTRSTTPLMIAIADEGGSRTPLKSDYGFKLDHKTPTAQAKKGPLHTYNSGKEMASNLLELGINTNFGVVGNLKEGKFRPSNKSSSEDKFCYSIKPRETALLAERFHSGASTVDGFAPVLKTFLKGNVPAQMQIDTFKKIINNPLSDIGSVLVSCDINDEIDIVPVACSEFAINKILREEIGFDGLIIAEDYETSTAVNEEDFKRFPEPHEIDQKKYKKYLISAINAGVNMLIISNNKLATLKHLENAVRIIYDAVELGDIDRSLIEESCEKIAKYKASRGLV